MSTKIYISFARRGVILDKPIEEQRFFSKKSSLETKTLENNERRYTSRSNVCPQCFIARAVKTQQCNCEE